MQPAKLPPLPLSDWEPSRLQLQLMCQILGKVRLRTHPFLNHWWHVPLYVSPRGLTTGTIPREYGSFDLELDLIDHEVVFRHASGSVERCPIRAEPIREFYRNVMRMLGERGIRPEIDPRPYECKSDVPFDEDGDHDAYDAEAVHRAWTVLVWADDMLKEFRSEYTGKCSPVHMFWHSFDLAVTRFSGRRAPEMPGANRVAQEAYSHEVSSAGFWFGDDSVPEPAFYAYSAPAPAGLTDRALLPGGAEWIELRGAPMALLRYEDVRLATRPKEDVQAFLQSSYEAGALAAGWDRASLERSGSRQPNT